MLFFDIYNIQELFDSKKITVIFPKFIGFTSSLLIKMKSNFYNYLY